MNVVSINIRGIGNVEKGDWIRNIRIRNGAAFVLIQETQFASLEGFNISRFWGNDNYGMECVDATGRSGGLVTLWDNKKYNSVSVLKNRYFLSLGGIVKESGKELCVINVYAPQKPADKKVLWVKLARFLDNYRGMVIIGGDFNCVRNRDERRNSKFNVGSASDFNEFLEEVGLHEYGLRGRKFMYVTGNKCSRIDRIFVSWDVLSEWPNAKYRALDREKSDHSPLILKVEDRNYGPKPFKFFNSWLHRKDFDDVVSKACLDYNGRGDPDKDSVNKEEEVEYASLSKEVNDLDEIVEERDLVEAEQWIYWEAKVRLKELEEFKAKDLRQKSRVKWAKEGDENTSFFHSVINKRRVSNAIPGLVVNGVG
ncbi:uncharacterized protein LOC110875476 [Helianthus annuus]|uniref:uncharacterized protein LOC110875476 n=1 Tax=Helianthus annuus TaxID=4232 RepID=UPI000B907525|nr:uncharacterized protein LOC110875476 [Helianthus annuus]